MDKVIDFIINNSSKIFSAGLVILAGLLAYFLLSRLLSLFANRNFIPDSFLTVSRKITRWILTGIVILLLLQQAGIKLSAIFTSLIAMATLVAIGFFAIWSVLSNFLCSLLVIIFSPFHVGDDIEICEVVGGSGLRGKVVDFNVMYTLILEAGDEPDNKKALIRVPNNIFFQKAVKRWKGEDRERIEKYLVKKSIMD